MVDVLKEKTIFIGREPEQGRLLIAIKGIPKIATLGQINSVPNSVSRCKPAEGVAHCQIEVDQASNMTLTNLKAQNVTFVNGAEIMSKHINMASTVALGKDKFGINVTEVLNTAQKIMMLVERVPSGNGCSGGGGGTGGGPYSILHLKNVWDDYSGSLKR